MECEMWSVENSKLKAYTHCWIKQIVKIYMSVDTIYMVYERNTFNMLKYDVWLRIHVLFQFISPFDWTQYPNI